jgi:hypothetical protein
VTFYLGRPGALFAIAHPAQGIDASPVITAAVQQSLGGARTVDHLGSPRRTYTMSRSWLTLDEQGVLEGLAVGAYGPGPFALVDPWRRNVLTPNQSSGSDVDGTANTDFWLNHGAGFPLSDTAVPYQGRRSVAWDVTAVNNALLTGGTDWGSVDPVRDPVPVPAATYTGSAWLRIATGTATVRAYLDWHNAAGDLSPEGASVGSNVALPTGVWTQVSATGAAWGNAGYVRLAFQVMALSGAARIYLDALQVEQAATPSAWVVGSGSPRVSFTSLTNTYTHPLAIDGSWTLQEVG